MSRFEMATNLLFKSRPQMMFSRIRSKTKPPVGLTWRSSKSFIIFIVTWSIFTDIFLYSLIIPILPWALQERVHIDAENISKWVSVLIAVFGGALAATSPFFGWVADHTKTRKVPFLAGLIALAGGTLMLHQGRSIAVLVVARIVQGSSASVVWIVGLALLADTVGPDEVGNAMGYVFIGTSLGLLFGPLLGGIVFDRTGYDAVFGIAYGVIGFDVLLRFIVIEKAEALKWQSTDEIEKANVITPGENERIVDGRPVQVATSNDIGTDKKRRHTMVTLLRSKRLLAALWSTTVIAILTTAFEATLPLYVKQIWSWTSTGAGLLFLALVVPSFIGPVVGSISDRIGARWLATGGLLLIVPFEVCLRFVDSDTIGQKVLLVVLLVLFGLSLNLVVPPIMADITLVVQDKVKKNPAIFGKKSAYAQAYGLFNLSYALGSMIGPLWGGFVRTAAGWGTMGWTLGLLSGISAIPAAVWCGGAIYRKNE